MSTVVHYVKHWDNDTKGSVSFEGINDVVQAAWKTREALLEDAVADGVDVTKSAPAQLFTITKVELVDSVQAYAGTPRASF